MSGHGSQAPSQAIRVSYGRPTERYAWLPIPLLLAVMAVLWTADLRAEYACPRLQMVLSFFTRTLTSFFIMYLIGRRFLVQGSPGLLFLGCGVGIWGVTGFITSVVTLHDANLGVTISNLGAWFSALCHLSGTVVAARPPRSTRAAWFWLGSGYSLVFGLAGLLTLAAGVGWLPLFFVQGQGGTLTRHLVLSSAMAMFVFAALLMRGANRPFSSAFSRWYSGALWLIAVGLLGMMVQTSRNTALDWTCRATQYLGGVYMLVAALAVMRERYFSWIVFGQAMGETRYRYGLAITAVLAAAAARMVFFQVLGNSAPFVVVYPAVMLAAFYGGLLPGLLATVLSALLANCFWIEPVGWLSYREPADWVSLAIFLLSCGMTSFIVEAMHRARAKAAAGEAEVRFAAERVRASEALRSREELNRRTLQALPAHIAVIDGQGRIIAVNQAWREFARANGAAGSPAVAVGASYVDACRRAADEKHPLAARALDGLEAVLRGTCDPFTMEYPCHSPEKQRWFFMTVVSLGAEGGAVVTHLDITERKEMEEALFANEERLRLALDAGAMGTWDWTIASGETVWNDETYRVLGYAVGEVTPSYRAWADRIHPDDVAAVEAIQRKSQEQGTEYSTEYRVLRLDGSVRWLESRGRFECDAACRALRSYGVMMDTTGRKKSEEALRRSARELARSNRDLEQFAHVAAHDMKEPLRMVTGFTALLRDRYERQLDDKAREYIHFASDAAMRMQGLIDDLLAYAGVGRDPTVTVVDTVEAVQQALANLRISVAESGARIVCEPLPTVQANALELAQLFQNLIGNAIKFRDPQRTVEVRITVRRMVEGERDLSGMQVSGWVFTVRDNGIGIAPQYTERIFAIFQRLHTREEYPGTGVGLAICKKIVERHGGKIWVESQPGEGSTFYFTMPGAPA